MVRGHRCVVSMGHVAVLVGVLACDSVVGLHLQVLVRVGQDQTQHGPLQLRAARVPVCTRGSCTPDVVQLFDSVQSIERTEHSVKPEEFRTIIDTLYPYGKRLEMFARRTAGGAWETWGNEA